MNFGKQKRKTHNRLNNKIPKKAICNKGFSGKSSILPRIKFRVCVDRKVVRNPLESTGKTGALWQKGCNKAPEYYHLLVVILRETKWSEESIFDFQAIMKYSQKTNKTLRIKSTKPPEPIAPLAPELCVPDCGGFCWSLPKLLS